MLIALGLSLLSAPLLGAAEPDPFRDATLPELPEPQELVTLKDASVKELIAILSRPEKPIRVPDNSVSGFHMVSLWHRSSSLLASHLDEARPLLAEMLHSEAADTRANALDVLMIDDAENLESLRPDFVSLLADQSRRVRIASARILPKVKNATVEISLLAALSKADAERPRSDQADNELRAIIDALCAEPLREDKVVPALARLLDESHSSLKIVWTTMQATAPLSRSERFGADLIARYWSILSTTKDESLPYIATGSMSESDDRTLACLRKARTIANPKARGYAAGALVSHDRFNPQHEEELFTALLEDGSPWVRRLVIANLSERRKDIDQKFQISTALKMCDEDPDKDVRANAMAGVFNVLYRASKDLRADIIGDRGLSVPRRMTKALGDEALQGIVVYQTGRLAGEIWDASDGEAAVDKARSWWEKLPSKPKQRNEEKIEQGAPSNGGQRPSLDSGFHPRRG